MKRISWFLRILLAVFIVLAPGANLRSGSAQPDGGGPGLPTGGDWLWNSKLALGPDQSIYAEVVDASTGDVYVGGDVTTIGGVFTGMVARYGASDHLWHSLGKDITWGRVYSLAISNGYLYVGGYFDAVSDRDILVNGIARWNMSTNAWSKVGSGDGLTPGSGEVLALAVDSSNNVYAGGDFTAINGTPALNMAKWNGSAWSALAGGVGTASEEVDALLWHGSTLYAGGRFATLKNIAAWSGGSWSTLGGGADKDVLALAADSNFIYAGGSFTHVYFGTTTVPVHYIAQWTASSGGYWLDMNGGFDGPDVDALAVGPDGSLYAGGRFYQSGSTPTHNIARWNSGNWEQLEATTSLVEGVQDNVYALAFSGQDLWVGGSITSAGDYSADRVIKWNLTDKQWHTPGGNAPNGPIYAEVVQYPNIYYGGAFTSAGTVQTNGVARFNVLTNTWSALGTGLSGCSNVDCNGPEVHALALYGSSLYVGGNFTGAGDKEVRGLASFDLSGSNTWSDVGGGVGCTSVVIFFPCSTMVNALYFSGSNLFVGGQFQWVTSGIYTTTVNNVVERSAGGWLALHDPTLGKTGTNGVVNAIEVNPANSDIYIGGAFTSPANNIAMWSSGSWLAVGSGVINGAVYALDYWGGSLYIGGDFTNAGGLGADHLARLNSSNLWTAVGGSVDDSVRALADNGAELLVGGYFRNVNGGTLPMYQVVRWTGSKWIALGSGMMGEYGVPRTVNAIVINGPYVYLGGNFRGAGPYISDNIAIWGGYARFMPLIKR